MLYESVNRELVVNVCANDVGHFEPIFLHNLRVWGGQIDRFRIIVDTVNSANGRYFSRSFDENLDALRATLRRLEERHANVIVNEVDYSPDVMRQVSMAIFKRDNVPLKAWDGGPLYAYVFGLWVSRARAILRIDCDMMFGGLSPTWIQDAEDLLARDPNVVFVAPLGGPPVLPGDTPADPRFRPASYIRHMIGTDGDDVVGVCGHLGAIYYRTASTRVFFTQMELLRQRLGHIDLLAPSAVQQLKAIVLGNPPKTLEFEVLLSRRLVEMGRFRADLLGGAPGMWSIHPVYRNANFFCNLEDIIYRIETGDIPAAQRGQYNMTDDLCDVLDARRADHKFQRVKRYIYHAINRFLI